MRVDKAALQSQPRGWNFLLKLLSRPIFHFPLPTSTSKHQHHARLSIEHRSQWQALRRSTRPRPELRSLQPTRSFLAWMVTQTRRRSSTSRIMMMMRFTLKLMMMLPRYEQLLPLPIELFLSKLSRPRLAQGRFECKHHTSALQQTELTSPSIGRKEQGSYFEFYPSGSPPWY